MFLLSLIFAWTALSGFQSTETLFLPKPPFRVFDLPSCFFLFLDKVFLDCIGIHRACEHFTVLSGKSHCITRENSFDNIWALIIRCPLAPWVRLEGLYLLERKVSLFKSMWTNPLICDDLACDAVAANDVILDKLDYHLFSHIGMGCCFHPFGEVVDSRWDETMSV